MSFDPIPPDEFSSLFPARAGDLPPKTFEFGLVLGGTVSAGAYTAGVLDFLVEALDAWEGAKKRGLDVPRHKVVLRVVAGASGGAVCGATLGRIARAAIPPATAAANAATLKKNPFYDVWVNTLDIGGMLKVDDATASNSSLCHPGPIDTATYNVKNFAGGPLVTRDWMANPLTLFMTVTNLRGVPYTTSFQNSNLVFSLVDHADYGRFAVETGPSPQRDFRPDEFISFTEPGKIQTWGDYGDYARASGAFPFGFPTRVLYPPLQHYRYRAVALPGEEGQPGEVVQRIPDWSLMQANQDHQYQIRVVDGGTVNNQPFQLARSELMGWLGRLPKGGATANRALIYVDPFNEKPKLDPLEKDLSLEGLLMPLVGGLKDQSRYGTRDLRMMEEEGLFGLFMITARRNKQGGGEWLGSEAICGAGLEAFLGFMSKAYRRHDYLLGRANCQAFLLKDFVVPKDNPVVAGWTAAQDRDHAIKDENGVVRYRRLIPLVDSPSALIDPTSPYPPPTRTSTPATLVDPKDNPWPVGAFDPEKIRDDVSGRAAAVFNAIQGSLQVGFLGEVYLGIAQGTVVDTLTNKIMDALTDEVGKLEQRL